MALYDDPFNAYFDVADELDGGLTLADLDDAVIKEAHAWATATMAPWPPELAYAEDAYLDREAAAARRNRDERLRCIR